MYSFFAKVIFPEDEATKLEENGLSIHENKSLGEGRRDLVRGVPGWVLPCVMRFEPGV